MGDTYKIPDNILSFINSELIKHPTGDGVRRAKFILKNRILTKDAIKRIKHDFSSISDNISYNLAGGQLMLNFINNILNSATTQNNISNNVKRDSNINVNSAVHAQQNTRIDALKI
jgi:hypothetical protein